LCWGEEEDRAMSIKEKFIFCLFQKKKKDNGERRFPPKKGIQWGRRAGTFNIEHQGELERKAGLKPFFEKIKKKVFR